MKTRVKKILIGIGLIILIISIVLVSFVYVPLPAPGESVSLYKGFWEPAPDTAFQTAFFELGSLKNLGSNALSFAPFYMPKDDGTFEQPPFGKETVIAEIQNVHLQGMKVYLVPTFWALDMLPDPSKA